MALQSRSLTRDARRETRAKTMNFKLPHDVVFTYAKRDEPPSRRRPIGIFRFQKSPSINKRFRTMADVCEAFVCFVCFVVKNSCSFVFIRGC